MSLRNWFWLLSLLFLAFLLRLFQLEVQSIWWDEGISLHLATSDVAEIARDRLNNIHPPLYFLMLKGWLFLTGANVFGARYLSVLASWLQVGALFAIVRRWHSLKTAYIAGILGTISAVSIIYGQEVRVYAMLPLIYLALLAFTREATSRRIRSYATHWGFWIAFGLVMWIGLHLHYITLFVVFYINVWALFIFIKEQRWPMLKRWIVFQFIVILASLPWFVSVVLNWTKVAGEANAGTFTSEPVPLQYLLNQIWTFHFTGLPGMIAKPGSVVLVTVLVGLILCLFLLRFVQKATRRESVFLVSAWLIPLSSALIVWTVRSFSHPRYVAIFLPGLIVFVSYLILPPRSGLPRRWVRFAQVLSALLFSGLIAASLWGLALYFFDPEVAKDDMRGVARYLEKTTKESDLILVPDTDWSLPFEYKGKTRIAMPHLDDSDGGWSHMARLTGEKKRVYQVDYIDGTRDWQRRLPFALAKSGSFVDRQFFDGLEVSVYELDESITAPQLTSKFVDFGHLTLNDIWIEQDSRTGDLVAVALNWRLPTAIEERVQVSLRLLDEQGWSVASSDDMLRDENGRPTDQWRPGDQVTTYHTLSLSPATAPVDYELSMRVYFEHGEQIQSLEILDEQGAPQGQEISLGTVKLKYEPVHNTDQKIALPLVPWSSPSSIVPGLALLGAESEQESYTPGDIVSVALLWEALDESLEDLRPVIALVQESNDLDRDGRAPVYGKYPTERWSAGQLVFERRQLKIPPTATGMLEVVLRYGEETLSIAEIEVVAGEHLFDPVPAQYQLDVEFGNLARLTGFDIEKKDFVRDESIPLTLLWQSKVDGADTDFVVFTHLLNESGRLIGQHDAPPDNGLRRTTGWVADEYVIDRHEIDMREHYQGSALIEVGFYDPVTGERVLLPDGADHFILPIAINVLP